MAMRRMWESLRGAFCKVLCILLSVLLVIQGSQILYAYAEERASVESGLEKSQVASVDDADKCDYDSSDAKKHQLACMFQFRDGSECQVSVAYDDDALIPDGAELRVAEASEEDIASHRSAFREIALVGEDDYVFYERYVNIQFVAEGRTVEPASPVELSMQTSSIALAYVPLVEVARLSAGDARDNGERLTVRDATAQKSEDGVSQQQNITEGLIAGKEDAESEERAKLSFTTKRLGTFAIAATAGTLHSWQTDDLMVSLLGPRSNSSVAIDEVAPPQLEDGAEPMECFSVRVDDSSWKGTAFWLAAKPHAVDRSEKELVGVEEHGGSVAYSFKDGESPKVLFDSKGTNVPVAFKAGEEKVCLAWTHVSDEAAPTVESQVPAEDKTGPVAPEPTPEASEAPEDRVASTREENATQVESLKQDMNAQEKNVEPQKVLLADASEGVLLAQDDASGAETRTAMSFTLHARAKTYGRSGKVYFVDEQANRLPGTVLNDVTISYTGIADSSNETNTVDMYSFIDKLSPEITDEYEFSRVYVMLDASANRHKDFRYVQVGDDRNISPTGSTSTYRAYFYMESIDQNRAGEVYNGTWYTLNSAGTIDDIFIEYYHVADASFKALDTRGNPVEGAEFTLYTDSTCYEAFEYKDSVVKAVSNRRGEVSFGKIPRGTYYMKETVIPDGYKKSIQVYTVTVDGETPIADVIHQDDDGSVIITDAKQATITKQWQDEGQSHEGHTVEVTVYSTGEEDRHVTLSSQNNWTYKLDGLNPNDTYEIEETDIKDAQGKSVKRDWAADITTEVSEEHIEYQRVEDFLKGKQYVIVAPNGAAFNALSAGSDALRLQAVLVSNNMIASEVSDDMLWNVSKVNNDGFISLQNMQTDKYLDYDGAYSGRNVKFWFQNAEEPQFIHFVDDNGAINIYYRKNLNKTDTYWMYMANKIDRITNNQYYATDFSIYRKVDVKSYDITITNKPTTYPVKIQNLEYISSKPLPGMTYKLYAADAYNSDNPSASGAPLHEVLVAGEDGYLQTPNASKVVSLRAGSYVLVPSGGDEAYSPLPQPVGFTITPKGMMSVQNVNGELPFYAVGSSETEGTGEGAVTYPLLQIYRYKHASVELTLDVRGGYADLTRQFEFTLTLPETVEEVQGSIDGEPVVLSAANPTFRLSHGQVLRLTDIPSNEQYVIAQERTPYVTSAEETDGTGRVNVAYRDGDSHAVVLSEIKGTSDDPARVTITNVLEDSKVLPTGVEDNTDAWTVAIGLSVAALAALWMRRRVTGRSIG